MTDRSPIHIAAKHIGFPSIALFRDLSLSLEHGQFTALLGPSGSGKSTLFRILAGLSLPEGLCVESLDSSVPLGENTSLLLQRDGLFPWLTVFENAAIRYRLKDTPPLNLKAKVMDILDQVGLSNVAHDLPAKLSGGMRQRVALARILLDERPVILMDEPFSSLDPTMRQTLYDLSRKHLSSKAVFFITHNHSEASLLADTILEVNPQNKTLQRKILHA